eukprot:938970-Rhodomonas_salina.2
MSPKSTPTVATAHCICVSFSDLSRACSHAHPRLLACALTWCGPCDRARGRCCSTRDQRQAARS